MNNIVLIMEKPYQIIFLILISIFVKLSITSPIITKERNPEVQQNQKIEIIYYANTSATFNLILSGDIEINPGPGFSAPKCAVCGKVVKINNKRLRCSTCFDVIHAKCSKQPSYHTIQARISRYYTCNRCLHTQLPFFNVSNLDSSYDMCSTANGNRLSTQNTSSNITNSNKTISIAHLNTQAICSTFDEFTCMLNTQKFDIMTLSGIWLKDNPHLLDCVKIDGYEVKFRNRKHTRGDGVGLYIRSDIKYKLRNDIVNTNTDIEHLWLEVTLRNKNSNLLLDIFYHPNFDNLAKSIWLDKFDNILSYACFRWNNSIVICGDMNSDLSKPDELIQKRYLSIL